MAKVSRKIHETQNVGNVHIQCISLYQTNENVPISILLCVFFLHVDFQYSHYISHYNCYKELHKLIHSYAMSRWVCYKGVWWWFYICNEPIGVANPELLEDLSVQGQQNNSATPNPNRMIKTWQIQVFHCATSSWTLSAW